MGVEVQVWRRNAQSLRMQGEICPDCNKIIFPPRDACPGCGGQTIIPKPKYGEGIKKYDIMGNGRPIIPIEFRPTSDKIVPND